jgi:hypothetical protein
MGFFIVALQHGASNGDRDTWGMRWQLQFDLVRETSGVCQTAATTSAHCKTSLMVGGIQRW